MKGRTRTLRLLLVGLAALGLGGLFASSAAAIDPGDFAELSTGIGRVVVRDCQNHLLSQGTGFLVGTRVLMTAHHVLDVPHACQVRIQIGARTYTVDRWTAWHGRGKKTEQAVDVETIHITTAASGHIYEFAHSVPNLDATVAMIGFPAGNPIIATVASRFGTEWANS